MVPRLLIAACCLTACPLAGCSDRAAAPGDTPSPACIEFCAREVPSRYTSVGEGSSCHGCFGVDATGQGACRADLNRADKMELAGIIRLTVSGLDAHLTTGEQCEAVLCPLADALDSHRHAVPFESVAEFDYAVSRPDFIGAQGLMGIDVRTDGGTNATTGQVWFGLKDLSYVEVDPFARSCCVGTGCESAEHRCANEALVELPTDCSSTP